MKKIIIGTRGSELALWQAEYTKQLLEKNGYIIEIKIISTKGDQSQEWNTAFDKIEGKGFFTKELEEALLKKEIDLAVHSHKDLPTENVDGLIIAGVSEREDPAELLLVRNDATDDKEQFHLKKNAIVGTSSARRKSQLLAYRSDVEIRELRGNITTRIEKLRKGEYDAIMLAYAGVYRLNLDLSEFHEEKLSVNEFVPAPAQGVLAWQIRENDYDLQNAIEKINNEEVQYLISMERKILSLFEGGCLLPLGVLCESDISDSDRNMWRFYISKAEAWNKQPIQLRVETHFPFEFPEKIVESIKNFQPKKIFITKNFKEGDYLPKALKRLGCDVTAQSLIEFKEIPYNFVPSTDWIFFSSKHAVRYFFNQNPKIGNVKMGCIGKSTSAELRNFGHRADFIGQNTDTKMVGKQFASLVGKAKVLFPIAKESLQSVQWQFVSRENAINLNVYSTIKHPVTIDPTTQIIIFTSPSNVESFFDLNKWEANYKAIAMGEATANALERKRVKKYIKPFSFDDLGLFQSVMSL
jgi:hydroxymethylbilane synthase